MEVQKPQETVEKPVETPAEETTQSDEKKTVGGSSFYKTKISEIQTENDALRQQIEELQTAQLQEKENFKELWELEKAKRVNAEEKATQISTSYFNGLKMSAIEQEAIRLGIREQALHDIAMIDNSIVQIETTSTGNANVLGAREFVEQLKETRPHWFGDQSAPIVNSANPQMSTVNDLTPAQLAALQKTDPAKYKAEMKRKYNLS